MAWCNSQLGRLSELIDTIVGRLRKKLPRKARQAEERSRFKRAESPRRSASTNPHALNRLSVPKKTAEPEPEHLPTPATRTRDRGGSSGDASRGAQSLTPWEVTEIGPHCGAARSPEEGGSTMRCQILHLESRIKKAEERSGASDEQARKALLESQRLGRLLDQRDEKMELFRQMHRESQMKIEKVERAAANTPAAATASDGVASGGGDSTVHYEAELRKRAGIVAQQEIAIEKWQSKARALECKNRLMSEQLKKASRDGVGSGLNGAGDDEGGVLSRRGGARRVPTLESQVAVQRDKLREVKEALHFVRPPVHACAVPAYSLCTVATLFKCGRQMHY